MAADKAHLGTYPENELSRKFTLSWLTNKNWLVNDDIPEFNDGKGLANSIDVETTPWENIDEGKKKLACLALKIGQYHRSVTDLENPRKEMAIGLAAIEIFQRFKNEDKDSQKVSTMQLSWKEAAAVANKWIRMVDLNEPSFWIDDLYTGKISGIPPEVLYHRVVHKKSDLRCPLRFLYHWKALFLTNRMVQLTLSGEVRKIFYEFFKK